MQTRRHITYRCDECGFSTGDAHLIENHSCDIQLHGGSCEDYPCCGHEQGDCNGLKYGSDESIKERVYEHIHCEHEHGFCYIDNDYEEDDEDGDD